MRAIAIQNTSMSWKRALFRFACIVVLEVGVGSEHSVFDVLLYDTYKAYTSIWVRHVLCSYMFYSGLSSIRYLVSGF